MVNQPPKIALRFLQWFCRKDYLEELEGNLIELFEKQSDKSIRRAKWKFTIAVLLHFRPAYIFFFPRIHQLNQFNMFFHYVRTAWRNLIKQKIHALTNIGGLAIGLACFILIFLYVQYEFSYDRFYEDDDRIYRVIQRWAGNDFLGKDYLAATPAGLAATLLDKFPEVSHATTIERERRLLENQDESYFEFGYRVDDQFFEVFPHNFLMGESKTSLDYEESIILTKSFAEKVFGNENPMGKYLTYENNKRYQISGVIEDLPDNSSFEYSYITNIKQSNDYIRDQNFEEKWYSSSFFTYFRMLEGTDSGQLQGKLQALLDKVSEGNNPFPFQVSYLVQPLSQIYLESRAAEDLEVKGNRKYISLLSLIGICVLLLACINYMNLMLARSIKRAKEIGLRKAVGAIRGQLFGQFIGESLFTSFFALLLAIIITYYLYPSFGNLLERPLKFDLFSNSYLLPFLISLLLVVGILSGSYPAIIMSSLHPAQVLKGKVKGGFSKLNVQRVLIIFQYVTSIVLIIASIVIYSQLQFIQEKDLGYNKEHIVTIPVLEERAHERIDLDVLKNEWQSYPSVLGYTMSSSLPTNIDASSIINYDYSKGGEQEEGVSIYRVRVDYDFLDLYDIPLAAGRNFSRSYASDTLESSIINETAAKSLGWTPEQALGKTFLDGDVDRRIVGVVKDFHMHSLHMNIEPLMMLLNDEYYGVISVKISPNNLRESIGFLESSIKKYSNYPFEYTFLDEEFDQLYKSDIRLGRMLGFFTILSILIASMGLFGLAAFSTEQRTKEIGIRKVLGAEVDKIILLLSKDFLKMVFVGFILAIPIVWYAMDVWLSDFAYRIEMEWWMFGVAGLTAIGIALFTISSQTLKAAFSDPIKSLKDE